MEKNRTLRTAFALNIVIVAMELVGFTLNLMKEKSLEILQYYTQLSNLLLLVACFSMAIFQWSALRHGRDIPAWVRLLRYVATCCVAVTFTVVIFVLAPDEASERGIAGYFDMLMGGYLFYFHFACPILAIVNLSFFEKNSDLRPTIALLALLPTVLYAVVGITLNALRVMDGPYFFLKVHDQPIYMSIVWCVVVLGTAYALAYALYRANRQKISLSK